MDFLDTVIGHPQNRLVDWITIHPRTRRTPSTTPIRAEALEILTKKYSPILPVLLSGDVFDINSLPFTSFDAPADPSLETLTLSDILPSSNQTLTTSSTNGSSSPIPTPANTNLAGFMSARGLLSNPALFAGHRICPWEAVETFMCNVARAPLPFKLTQHHIQEMCAPGMGRDKSALLSRKDRARIMSLTNMVDLVDFLDERIEARMGQSGGLRRDL